MISNAETQIAVADSHAEQQALSTGARSLALSAGALALQVAARAHRAEGVVPRRTEHGSAISMSTGKGGGRLLGSMRRPESDVSS